MIKTLRITSIGVAVLAGLFFIFPVVFGLEKDDRIEQVLDSPGAVEMYMETAARRNGGEAETSPLVKQAEAFALYLNPPAPARPKTEKPAAAAPVQRPRPQEVAARFKLLGTSVHPAVPELSLALIEEPAKGTMWVRQSATVGHLVIEQVRDGSAVIRDGDKTFELVAERPKKKSLVKGQDEPEPAAGGQEAAPPGGEPASPGAAAMPGDSDSTGTLDRLVADVRAMAATMDQQAGDKIEQRDDPSQGPEALMQELLKSVRAMRVTADEARRLNRLGRELDEGAAGEPNEAAEPGAGKAGEDPNGPVDSKIEDGGGDPNKTGDSKIERDRGEPNGEGDSKVEKDAEQE
jgi:hypothetical protein